jgi:hypothetical protein
MIAWEGSRIRCSISWSTECESYTTVECYKCGLDVCKSCSRIMSYLKKRCRICEACIEDDRRSAKPVVKPVKKKIRETARKLLSETAEFLCTDDGEQGDYCRFCRTQWSMVLVCHAQSCLFVRIKRFLK